MQPAAELTAARVSEATVPEVVAWLDGSSDGLTSAQAAFRLLRDRPNVFRSHRVSAIAVLARQLRIALGFVNEYRASQTRCRCLDCAAVSRVLAYREKVHASEPID